MDKSYLVVIGVFLAALIGTVVASFLTRRKKIEPDDLALENKISKVASEALDKNSERFLQMAKEVLSSQKNEIRTDLEGKKSEI